MNFISSYFSKAQAKFKQPLTRVKTKCTLQFEAVECGAASLRTILSYYGRFVDLSELRQRCGVTRDGSKASKIVLAAEHFGLDNIAERLSFEELISEGKFPCILFWNFNHFLVCEGYDDEKFYLSDPAQGRRSVSHDEFADSFTGIYISFSPNDTFEKGGKDQFPERLFLKLIKPYKAIILYSFALTLAAALANIFISLCSMIFIDRVMQYGQIELAPPVVLALLLLSSLLIVTLALRFYLLRRMEVILSRRFALKFSQHLLEVSYRYYTQRMAGEISGRIANSATFIHTTISSVLTYSFSLLQGVFAMLAMTLISVPLTIFSAGALILNTTIAILLTQSREDSNKKLALDLGKSNGVGLYGIKSIQSIKAGGRENEFFNRWSGYFMKASQAQQQMGFQITQLSTISQTTNFALQLFILSYGGYQILSGNLSLGGLIGYTYLLTVFQVPLTSLPSAIKAYQQIVGDAGRVLDGLDEPVDTKLVSSLDIEFFKNNRNNTNISNPEIASTTDIAIEFKEIVFGFNVIDPPLFPKLDFSIKKGEFISIIGPSGCGKSTIAKLITGLYQPLSGDLEIFGRQLRSYTSSEAIQLVGYVPQEVFVYSQSFRDNITLFNPLIDDNSVYKAFNDACLIDVVEKSERGLDTLLRDNGADLSGGQRQRLEIARALSRNPSVIILDEATSALDNKIESRVFENIRSRQLTVFNVAHRLTSVSSSDKIICIENGEITDFDSPSSMKRDPMSLYSRLLSSETSTA